MDKGGLTQSGAGPAREFTRASPDHLRLYTAKLAGDLSLPDPGAGQVGEGAKALLEALADLPFVSSLTGVLKSNSGRQRRVRH